ncbi:hypothetical protein [Roseibium sp.]|uniref:hypothetical protein n=1 Tax=Roseibium sp. TaxID=1936156 RepID=UPI003A975A46
MRILKLAASCCLVTALAAGGAKGQEVDFKRFLASPAGAAGVAAAVAGLGQCDTELWWGISYDEAMGKENPDHLFVSCQYYDKEDETMYDKSVVAKFLFWDDKPVLESLTYLP